MTGDQLDALAALVGMRSGPALLAAGLVLVEGHRPADAAREAGLSPAAVSNALARLRRALDLAQRAAGGGLRRERAACESRAQEPLKSGGEYQGTTPPQRPLLNRA